MNYYYDANITSVADYYPGGSIMPGRNFSSNSYRYGLMGYEKDDEIKGSGNSYDMGERLYDPRLFRVPTIDKYANQFAYQSPYVFAGNNPILYIDHEGNFKIDVHARITRRALKGSGIPLINAFYVAAYYGSTHPDWKSITSPADWGAPDWVPGAGSQIVDEHFDNRNSFIAISHGWSQVSKRFDKMVELYKAGDNSLSGTASEDLGYRFGRLLHTIQDFYSHSNYVDLYVQVYGETADLNAIPTFEDAMLNEGGQYEEFSNLLKTELKTGYYGTHSEPGHGSGSHEEMNLDQGEGSIFTGKKASYQSKAAENLATRESKKWTKKLKEGIKQ
jgi:RHS repeat-associated protein